MYLTNRFGSTYEINLVTKTKFLVTDQKSFNSQVLSIKWTSFSVIFVNTNM